MSNRPRAHLEDTSKKRQYTDVSWLAISLAILGAWVFTGYYAFANSSQPRTSERRDVQGRRCGVDIGVEDKPYVFYQDTAKCTKSTCGNQYICVEKCPKDKLVFATNTSMKVFLKASSCDRDLKTGNCKLPHLELQCLPDLDVATSARLKFLPKHVDIISLQRAVKNIYKTAANEKIVGRYYPTLGELYMSVGICLAPTIAIAVIFAVLLAKLPMTMVYISFATFASFCAFYIFFFFVQMTKKIASEDSAELAVYCIFGTASVLGIFALFFILVLREDLARSAKLICESAIMARAVKCSYGIAITVLALKVILLQYGLVVLYLLIDTGEATHKIFDFSSDCKCIKEAENYDNGVKCIPSIIKKHCTNCSAVCAVIDVKMNSTSYMLFSLNIFSTLHFLFLLKSFGELCYAGMYSAWYWKKPRSLMKLCKYHLGTALFGSLVVQICRLIKSIALVSERISQLRDVIPCMKYSSRYFANVLSFCCVSSRVSRYSSIICAIDGSNYCKSAVVSNVIIGSNLHRVRDIDSVAKILYLTMVVFAVLAELGVCYLILFLLDKGLYSMWVPFGIMMVHSSIVTATVLNAFDTATSVLFICFLKDLEGSDASTEKLNPAPESLTNLFIYEEQDD